jgi:hypothetical protein
VPAHVVDVAQLLVSLLALLHANTAVAPRRTPHPAPIRNLLIFILYCFLLEAFYWDGDRPGLSASCSVPNRQFEINSFRTRD